MLPDAKWGTRPSAVTDQDAMTGTCCGLNDSEKASKDVRLEIEWSMVLLVVLAKGRNYELCMIHLTAADILYHHHNRV